MWRSSNIKGILYLGSILGSPCLGSCHVGTRHLRIWEHPLQVILYSKRATSHVLAVVRPESAGRLLGCGRMGKRHVLETQLQM